MKIAELIDKLQALSRELSPDTEVIVSSDEEGNSFNTLMDVEPTLAYEVDHGWDLFSSDEENEQLGVPNGAQTVIVLWP